jgi:NAD(P)H-dependent flavin oxidoreductase YrpB (nitropropane dioxygenase family)
MPFKARITELLEIEHPIVQGGMQSVGTAELASAVSNAGGLGILAALTQPSDGVNMGTRFCATQEAKIHPNVKQAYIDNDERGTNLIFRSLKNTARVRKSEVSDEVARRQSVPGATSGDVKELVAGDVGRDMLQTGDMTGRIKAMMA